MPNINLKATTKLFENLFSELLFRKKLLILSRSFFLYRRPFFFTLDKFFYPLNLFNESTLGILSPLKFRFYLYSRWIAKKKIKLSYKKFDKFGISRVFFVNIFQLLWL